MDSVDLGLSSLAHEFLKTFCQLIFSRKRQSKFVEFLHVPHRRRRRASLGDAHSPESDPELKGSIGEGPNHSHHSTHSNSFKIGIFSRKFKNFRKFQHFLNYRRNSDKISSKSEQKSVKRIQK